MNRLLIAFLLITSTVTLHGAAHHAIQAPDIFPLLKKLIASSPHQMSSSDWKYELNMPIGSNCIESAATVTQLLTGINATSRIRTFWDCLMYGRTMPELADDEFCDSMKQLTYTDHPVVHALLTNSPTPEHCIFYVLTNGPHAFVVEKVSDGRTTWWRIYQSWYGTFTMTEWLGSAPWRIHTTDTTMTKLYNYYGQGKKLNHGDLHAFINYLWVLQGYQPHFYIRQFRLDSTVPRLLQQKYRAEQKSAAAHSAITTNAHIRLIQHHKKRAEQLQFQKKLVKFGWYALLGAFTAGVCKYSLSLAQTSAH